MFQQRQRGLNSLPTYTKPAYYAQERNLCLTHDNTMLMSVSSTYLLWSVHHKLIISWSNDNLFLLNMEAKVDMSWKDFHLRIVQLVMCVCGPARTDWVFPHAPESQCYHTVNIASVVEWIFTCLFRWSFLVKAFLHESHTYGRSPVWIRRCRVNSSLRMNDFLHPGSWHTNGLSPGIERNKGLMNGWDWVGELTGEMGITEGDTRKRFNIVSGSSLGRANFKTTRLHTT